MGGRVERGGRAPSHYMCPLKSMKLFTKFKIPLASSALDPDLLT